MKTWRVVLCSWWFILGALVASLPGQSVAQDLRISTFNIKWYGADDVVDDYRDKYIRRFIHQELSDVEVLVLQEIVDVRRLENKVLGSDWDCRSYYGGKKHQHVAVCYKKDKYRFDRQPDDNNYTIESLKGIGGKARPAVYGILKTKSGRAVAHIVGVHLKAFPHETAKRISQAKSLARRLQKLEYKKLPIIITGDYNTYESELTGYSVDDAVILDRIFRDYDLNLRHVPNNYKYTYKSSDRGNLFDHFWVSRSVSIERSLYVSRPCRSRSFGGRGFEELGYYNHYVSDHCPVTVTLGLD